MINNFITLVKKQLIKLCVFSILLILSPSYADSFRHLQPFIHLSTSETYAVKINPAKKTDSCAVAELYKSKFERLIFQHQFKLKNKVAPVLVVLTNQGELITIDDWGNYGKGDVVYIYHQNGSLKFKYVLSDLVP